MADRFTKIYVGHPVHWMPSERRLTAVPGAPVTGVWLAMRHACAMQITALTTRCALAPLPRPIRTASGAIDRFPVVLLDLHTDTGVTGRAYVQSYLPALLPALDHTLRGLASMLVGQPLQPRALHALLSMRLRLLGTRGLAGIALSGLDMAAWDAWARAQGQPLAVALGAPLRPLKAYLSEGLYDAASVASVCEAAQAGGYAGLKVKLGFPSFAEDLAVVRQAQRLLGGHVALMVDYNQSLDLPEALRRCRALDDEGLTWIEEPVAAEDHAGCARIAAAIATPLQVGENFNGLYDMAASADAQASSFVMPDVQFIGGVTGWLEAAALARRHGLPMSSHLFVEASAQLLCATPTAHWIEVLDAAAGLRASSLRIEGGCLVPSAAPGMGMDWDEEAVARYAV